MTLWSHNSLAKARCYDTTEVAQLPLIRNKQAKAVRQYLWGKVGIVPTRWVFGVGTIVP